MGGQALVLHTMFLPQDMIPTRHDHQLLPYSQGPAANSAPEFWRVHCQHTTAAAMIVRLLVPQLAHLTSWTMESHDPALAGL